MKEPQITWDFGNGRVRPPFTIHKKPAVNGVHIAIRCDYLAWNGQYRNVNAFNLAWATVPDGMDVDLFANNLLALAELRYETEVANA